MDDFYLTYETWSEEKYQQKKETFKDYFDVLKWAYQTYQDNIVYACSFGAEGIVLIDLISKVDKFARIVFLDTDLHFEETYELIGKIKRKYPTLSIECLKPNLTLTEQENEFGKELWKRQPNLCCNIRKVEPLKQSLAGVDAWISGLRREQSPTRAKTEYINKDENFKKIKICPLIHWTWDDIWSYIELNNLPYNELHDKGFPSIGCEKCTVPVTDNKDLRSGRWMNSNKTECGLHKP